MTTEKTNCGFPFNEYGFWTGAAAFLFYYFRHLFAAREGFSIIVAYVGGNKVKLTSLKASKE
jgi:hypothetical protein